MTDPTHSCSWCGREFSDGDDITRIQAGEADVGSDGLSYTLSFNDGTQTFHVGCLAEWAQKYASLSPFTDS